MAFSDQVKHRFADFDENLDLPAVPINTYALFFGKSSICTDKGKPILAICFVPYVTNFCRNWIFFSYHNINRKQILWSARYWCYGNRFLWYSTTFHSMNIWSGCFFNHNYVIYTFWTDGCYLCRGGNICCEKRSKTELACFCRIKEMIESIFRKLFPKRVDSLLHIHTSCDKNITEFVTKQENRWDTFFFHSVAFGKKFADMMFEKNWKKIGKKWKKCLNTVN